MESYLKIDTLKRIVEVFAIINKYFQTNQIIIGRSYLEQYLSKWFSNNTKLEMLDYFSKFSDNDNFSLKTKEKCFAQLKLKFQDLYPNLNTKEKYDLYITILDYGLDLLKSQDSPSIQINEFHQLLVQNFKLHLYESEKSLLFMQKEFDNTEIIDQLIVVGNFSKIVLRSYHMHHLSSIKGKIYALYLNNIESFIIRYVGREELTLNKQIIFPDRVYVFTHGNIIEGEEFHFTFCDLYEDIQELSDNYIEVNVKQIQKVFPKTNLGIKEVSFNVGSGQLFAIMGGSGTGKTTLMNILSGIEKPDSGEVLINDTKLHSNTKLLNQYIGYVPQDDMLINELTVYQNLKYALYLSRKNINAKDVDNTITHTLKKLGLLAIKDLKVGSSLNKVISGGQRKRLNIALELVRNPRILFIDEPTSGLSTSDAYMVVKGLKELSKQGSIVVINIHQPPSSIFLMFDKLLLLDDNGYTAYYGCPYAASSYLKRHLNLVDSSNDDSFMYGTSNPEEIDNLLHFKKRGLNGEYTDNRLVSSLKWNKLFSENYNVSTSPIKKDKLSFVVNSIPSVLKQFWLYFERNIQVKARDYQFLIIVFLGVPILSALIAFFLKQTNLTNHQYVFLENENIPTYLFISVIVSLFLGLIISASEIFKDLPIIKRESFLNLNKGAYLNSKVLYLAIINAIQVLLYVYIGNLILEIKQMLVPFWIILWITSLSSSMLGLLVSAKFKSMLSIYITIPFLLIPQILLAGAILDFDSIHHNLTSHKYVPIYADINISRWSYEALITLQFTENSYDKDLLDLYILKSQLSYDLNFLLPKIETEIDLKNKKEDNITKIRFESLIEQLANHYPQLNIELSEFNLNYKSIKKLKKWLIENIKVINHQIDNYRKNANHLEKNKYRNSKLTDFVLKRNNYVKFIIEDEEMIRKFQPGYFVNSNSFGRSHYYAPYKTIFNFRIKTWKFNTFIIFILGFTFYSIIFFSLKNEKRY